LGDEIYNIKPEYVLLLYVELFPADFTHHSKQVQ
jgi:hypothetical protein